MARLTGISLNTRGLKGDFKRCSVFNWLRKKQYDFCFLQETHSDILLEAKWKLQWGNEILYSHGIGNGAGVAILFSGTQDIQIISTQRDCQGRILIATVRLDNKDKYTLVNIYAPTKNRVINQVLFLETLVNLFETHQGDNIIIGGDWNTILDNTKDKRGGVCEQYTKYQEELKKCIYTFQLSDIWRESNPGKMEFTWKQSKPHVETRLDYWLISQFLSPIVKTNIMPDKIKTDHKPIEIIITPQNYIKRGPGFWKFNTELLHDDSYTNNIITMIDQLKEDYIDMRDKGLKWDLIKCKIRGFTIKYSKAKKRKQLERSSSLELQQIE